MTNPTPARNTPLTRRELERQQERFISELAREHGLARLENRAYCPVKPMALREIDGEMYAVEQFVSGSFDTMAPTQFYDITFTRLSTGTRKGYGRVICQTRRNKKTAKATVRYNVASIGLNMKSWDDLMDALALDAAGVLNKGVEA
jgi:hypothetical protein